MVFRLLENAFLEKGRGGEETMGVANISFFYLNIKILIKCGGCLFIKPAIVSLRPCPREICKIILKFGISLANQIFYFLVIFSDIL